MTPNLERAKALFSGGLAAHGAGDWEGAERLYREALALAPGRPSLLFNLGRLLLDRERDAEAERLFGEVLQTTPHDHEAHCNLGICRARQGRFEEALASYDRAIALKQDFAEAHSNRGLALGKLARHEAALGSHARSVELAPESAAFQVRFARSATARALDERKLPAAALEPAVLACLLSGGSPGRSCAADSSGRGWTSRTASTLSNCTARSHRRSRRSAPTRCSFDRSNGSRSPIAPPRPFSPTSVPHSCA